MDQDTTQFYTQPKRSTSYREYMNYIANFYDSSEINVGTAVQLKQILSYVGINLAACVIIN